MDRAAPDPAGGLWLGTADAGLGYRLFETVASKFASHGDLGMISEGGGQGAVFIDGKVIMTPN